MFHILIQISHGFLCKSIIDNKSEQVWDFHDVQSGTPSDAYQYSILQCDNNIHNSLQKWQNCNNGL